MGVYICLSSEIGWLELIGVGAKRDEYGISSSLVDARIKSVELGR